VLFQNGFTPHPPRMPTRGVPVDGIILEDDDRETMAGVLHDAGYKFGLFGKNHVFTPAPLKRWFDFNNHYAANTTAGENTLNRGLSPEIVAQDAEA
jgi:arylsulfatase A-like enzyme